MRLKVDESQVDLTEEEVEASTRHGETRLQWQSQSSFTPEGTTVGTRNSWVTDLTRHLPLSNGSQKRADFPIPICYLKT